MAKMNREQGWLRVVAVGLLAIAVSLIGAWQARRDPAPALTVSERRTLYDSNLRNFTESCGSRAASDDNAGLLEFCRRQAQLLRRMAECDSECARRTSAFADSQPSR